MDGGLLAFGPSALTRSAGEGGGQSDGVGHLAWVQSQHLACSHGGSEHAVDWAGPEPSGLRGWDEVAGYAGFQLIARRHSRYQVSPGASINFAGRHGGRYHARPGVGEHPVGVGLACGMHHLGVGESGAPAADPGAVHPIRRRRPAGVLPVWSSP